MATSENEKVIIEAMQPEDRKLLIRDTVKQFHTLGKETKKFVFTFTHTHAHAHTQR